MVVVGHQRPLNAAIITLREATASKLTEEQRLLICLDAVKKANRAAPKHSRILDEMVFILPLGSEKKIPVTNKGAILYISTNADSVDSAFIGNFIRPKVAEMFAHELDYLYSQFSESRKDRMIQGIAGPGALDQHSIQEKILSILNALLGHKNYSPKENLFESTLDSVTAMAVRNRLSKEFSLALSQNFVYQNFTVQMMVNSLTQLIGSHGTKERDRNQICREIFDQQMYLLAHSAHLVKASRNTAFIPNVTVQSSEQQVVAVVGAAGSLGIWQVKALLESPSVAKVVCLARGRDVAHVYDKIIEALSRVYLHDLAERMRLWKNAQLNRSSTPAIDLGQRVVVVPFDLGRSELDQRDYFGLASGLTTIIHTAWKMDFNQVVSGFQDCISGTTQLLLLAAFIRPKSFYFVSSVGTVMESKVKPVREQVFSWPKAGGPLPASPHGYSESKFIAEHVVVAAAKLLNIPCAITRIGQITGDLGSGFWKATEMYPSIIRGSLRIGKYPRIPIITDWIPVENAAATTVEMALKLHTYRPSYPAVSVDHIANPNNTEYDWIFRKIQKISGRHLEEVSVKQWCDQIMKDDGNPCLPLTAYIEGSFSEIGLGEKSKVLEIRSTLEKSYALQKCPPLGENAWEKYLTKWKEEGFVE
ncbi:hypothetical protein VKT23_009938 [Stygiomarasmius scandens]|uniref:Carrier domain-containing protein n=1 Tax=Marasmiellus scandens TaxID=2682957 RepID=A0ABR1JFB5_9AGAR